MATPKGPDFSKNLLFYGDNLDVMRKWIKDETIDLIYLDPPFNSNRTYNVLFKHKSSAAPNAQITAFDDTWTWSQDDEVVFADLQASGGTVADAITAMRQIIGPSDMLSYLVMMTVRLVEMRRVLKPSGALYLHCDPVASHYLKIILDAIFGVEQFGAEIIWKRTTAHSDARQGRTLPGRVHDVILLYTKTDKFTGNVLYTPYDESYIASHYRFVEEGTGRQFRKDNLTAAKPGGDTSYEWNGVRPYKGRYWAYSRENMQRFHDEGRLIYTKSGMPELKRYLDEMPGLSLQDVWTDIDAINARASERLGYPTQKPLALLERIIATSSNAGDVVLDPFCGCGTAVDAAQRLGRRWIGMDISYLSIDLIETRLLDVHTASIEGTYEIVGVPRDVEGAEALFKRSPFDFERWAVSLIDGTPNEKQVGDRGIDGIVRFPISSANDIGKIIVSVKGGGLNPSMVRDLAGTVEAQNAAMGVLITNQVVTRGMIDAAQHSGTYKQPLTGNTYPKVQILTVGDLLAGRKPKMPTAFMPYLQAAKFVPGHPTLPGFG
jgi:DNA modification methylase